MSTETLDDLGAFVPPTDEPASPTPQPAEDEPTTFSAEYVRELRAEAAQHRVRAKLVDTANERLAAAYAAADGRLVDPDALRLTDDLFDDDGLADPGRVRDAITALIDAKPYLKSRKPTTTIDQGALPEAPAGPTWLDIIRGDAR